MRFLPLVVALCLAMTACSRETDRTSTAIKVEVVKTEQGYGLMRGGAPYIVRGAGMGGVDLERFAASGGNTMRTWNTSWPGLDTHALLDGAHQLGLTVALGLPMQPERHGFDYNDSDAVAEQFERMRAEVLKYRDHPAVLVWIIGNELNHSYTNPRVFDAVNDVAEMIHELDPYHPATTAIAGFSPDVIDEVMARAPSLDFLSFQLYGSLFKLHDGIESSGFDAPFMVTEWGAIGYWEVDKTDWGAPIENTSSEKADVFLRGYRDVLEPLDGQLLGSYVFYWGQKQERTPTWFGMLTEDGRVTEVVDVMQYAWTGEWPDNRTPRVERLSLDGLGSRDNVVLVAGQDYEVVFDVADPDGGTVGIRWELKPESAATAAGGDYEAPIDNLEGYLADPTAATTAMTAPPPGTYRLFAYADDDHQRVAHANIPFRVVEVPAQSQE